MTKNKVSCSVNGAKRPTRKPYLALRPTQTFRKVHLIGILMPLLTTFKFRTVQDILECQEKKQSTEIIDSRVLSKEFEILILIHVLR